MKIKIKIINANRYSGEKVCMNTNSKHFKLVLFDGGYDIFYYLPAFKKDDILEFDVTNSNKVPPGNVFIIKNKETQTFLKKYKNGFYDSYKRTNLIKYKVNGKDKQKTFKETISKPTNIGRHIEEINEKLLYHRSVGSEIKSEAKFKSYSNILLNKKLKELFDLDLDYIAPNIELPEVEDAKIIKQKVITENIKIKLNEDFNLINLNNNQIIDNIYLNNKNIKIDLFKAYLNDELEFENIKLETVEILMEGMLKSINILHISSSGKQLEYVHGNHMQKTYRQKDVVMYKLNGKLHSFIKISNVTHKTKRRKVFELINSILLDNNFNFTISEQHQFEDFKNLINNEDLRKLFQKSKRKEKFNNILNDDRIK